jgi:hypothetical protein
MSPSAPTRPEKRSTHATISIAPELLSFRAAWMAALCLIAAVFAVYSPTLHYEFVLDDHRFTSDPRIQFSGHIWDYFANYVWAQFTGGPPSFYRPIFILWLRINFMLSELSPWGWHLLSITKHVAVAVLLAWLAWKLLRDRAAALLAAALFALHPAQTESVAWVTVPDPLMSIGILGALLFFLRYVDANAPSDLAVEKKSRKARTKSSQPSSRWIAASTTACFAAMLAKETAIIFPALIFGAALYLPTDRSANSKSTTKNTERMIRLLQALRQTVPFLCAAALYVVLRFNALNGKLGARTQHLPWSTVVMSWPGILWFYIKAMLWPSRSYAFADPILVNQFAMCDVALPALGVAASIAVLVGILSWAWRKSSREFSSEQATHTYQGLLINQAMIIGTLLLVLPLLLALNLNALNPGDFLHGRYTYLPLAGLALLAATAWHLAGRLRIPLLCTAAAVVIAFSVLTIAQESMWHDDLTLFTTAHELAPHNGPVAQNLANARVQAALKLDEEGRCGEAMPVFEQVTREYPQDWFAWAGMGDCFLQLNDLIKAEDALHHAADLSHEPRVTQQWQQLRERMGLTNSPH